MRILTSFSVLPALGCLVLPLLFSHCKNDPQAHALKELQKKNYTLSEKSYLDAAAAGDLEAVKLLHQSGMAVDNRTAAGTTALMEAAKNGRVEVVKYLLEKKADTGVTDADLNTPLIKAAEIGNLEVVNALLAAGADATAANKMKMTALTTAAINNHASLIEPLLEKTKVDDINNALALAAVKGNAPVVGVLLNRGADSISRTAGDMTPLMLAAKNGRKEVVEMLVNNGAPLNSVDSNQKTASDLAAEANHKDIADYLNEMQSNPPKRKQVAVESPTGDGHAAGAVAEGDTGEAPRATVRLSGQKVRNSKPLGDTLRMLDYQSQTLPVLVTRVENESVILRLLADGSGKTITLKKGDLIPGTEYEITRLRKQERMTKNSGNALVDVSDMLLRHRGTRADVLVPVNDVPQTNDTEAVLGIDDRLFSARRGDEFTTEGDGETYRVLEVYPNRVVLLDKNSNSTMIVKRTNPVAGKF